MNRLRIWVRTAGWMPLLVCSASILAQEQPEQLAPPKPANPAEAKPEGQALALPDLIRIGLERNPALRQADLEIEAARGRAVQAGLYPNPTVSVVGEELGGRDGPGGFITAPLVSQEIVTGGKLKLSRAVAAQRVDQAGLALIRERFNLITAVRQGYFEVLAVQRRVQILQDLLKLATQSYETTRKLMDAGQVAELDLLQFQVERDRFQTEMEAARRELVAAWQRLTSSMGEPTLPYTGLQGSLEALLPDYEPARVRTLMLEEHPDILSTRFGITRAELSLRREKVERIPNVTMEAGYTRDNIGRQDEWTFRIGVPVPLFNHNQGNIQAAHAELGQATQEVNRVENVLINRLATAYGDYSASKQRAERYRTAIRPAALRAYQLAQGAFKGGQFEYLRVLQAQRSLAEADLEYNRALLEVWKAASQIAGLILEEHWPASILGVCDGQPRE